MTISPETRAELRRLHAAAQKALENERQTLADARAGQAESKEELAARLIGKIKADAAYQDAATSNLLPILDALEAAERERDRLREVLRMVVAYAPRPHQDDWLNPDAFEGYRAAYRTARAALREQP